MSKIPGLSDVSLGKTDTGHVDGPHVGHKTSNASSHAGSSSASHDPAVKTEGPMLTQAKHDAASGSSSGGAHPAQTPGHAGSGAQRSEGVGHAGNGAHPSTASHAGNGAQSSQGAGHAGNGAHASQTAGHAGNGAHASQGAGHADNGAHASQTPGHAAGGNGGHGSQTPGHAGNGAQTSQGAQRAGSGAQPSQTPGHAGSGQVSPPGGPGSSGQPSPTPGGPGSSGSGGQPSQTPGHAGSGAQPAQTPGHAGSGGHPSPTPGHAGSGGQPSQTPGHAGSGGQPTQTPGHAGSGGHPSPTPGHTGSGGHSSPTPGHAGGGHSSPTPGHAGSGAHPAIPGGNGHAGNGHGGNGHGGNGHSGLGGLLPNLSLDNGPRLLDQVLHGGGGAYGQDDGSTIKLGAVPENVVVHRVVGEERISTPYRYRISVVLPVNSPILDDFAETLVGQPGSLFFTAAGNRREIQGIAIAAALEGVLDDHEASLSIELVPHLALLGMRVHSRIFQDQTAIEVVKAVFEEWGIEHEVQLGDGYATRAYITQYQETDLAFVERLLASEGVAYYFTPGKTKEKVILIDDPAGYAPTPNKDGGRVSFAWALKDNQTYENIFGVRSERRLRPTGSRIGDYDFRKPGLALRNIVLADDEPAGFVRKFGAEMMSIYRHGDTTEVATGGKLDGEERRAKVALAQHRHDVDHMSATTRSRRMIPGHTVALTRHPIEPNNRDWVIVATKTTLTRARKQDHDGGAPESFECRFECAPADFLVRPAFPQRTIRQVSETATVVGPKGEAVFPDEHGRIKVKFHWDLSARDDDSASCWLHVSQSWVGANWGSQFVPRVGSEVVVTFLGGDPDRPLVTGSVYNGTHPPPFQLPAEVSTSGFRTQSFPGGEGFNELSFDDRSGSERLHLRAEKDLDVLAQNDSKMNVGRDHELEVKRDLKETVSGAHSLRVVGGQAVLLEKDSDVQVGGDAMMSVTGNYDLRVSNDRVTRVEGTDRAEITGDSFTTFTSDQVERILGHKVTVIGDSDAQRSVSTHVEGTAATYSTGLTEIASETVMVFRVGESAIRMTPKAIEIFAPNIFLQGDKLSGLFDKQVNLHSEKKINLSSERIHLAGKQAAIDLLENARIDGKQVKLNCTPEPEPEDAHKEPKPTTIKLADEDGNPLGHQRFVVVHGDGSQRSGVTSDEGKASVLLDASGQIFFPDVDDARKE